MKKVAYTAIIVVGIFLLFIFWGGGKLTEYNTNKKIEKLRNSVNFGKKKVFTYKKLNHLPPQLFKYFHTVLTDSFIIPNYVSVEQTAKFKTSKKSNWLPVKAKEYFSTGKPNYIWNAETQTNKLFWVKTIDSYLNGKGNMLIKINSSITISDANNIEMDKAGLFRYFSEALFFPTSLLPNDSLMWNILDTNIAEIKFKDKSTTIVAKVYFNKKGTIDKITTYDKYRTSENGYSKTLYTIYYYKYKWYDEKYFIPTHYDLEWKLPEGKFKYAKFNIIKINYE